MYSMRHDLRDALDEDVCPESIQATAAAFDQHSSAVVLVCSKCGSPPAPGDKLRYCGRCASKCYCTKDYVREDCPTHKPLCESMLLSRAKALADYEARGGRKQDYRQLYRDVTS